MIAESPVASSIATCVRASWPFARHEDDLDPVHERDRVGDSLRTVEEVLDPQMRAQRRTRPVARPEIGVVEVEQVRREAALVDPVGRADSVDRRHDRAIARRPRQPAVRHELTTQDAPVVGESAGQHEKERLRRVGPVHRAGGHTGFRTIPEDAVHIVTPHSPQT